MIQLTVSRNGKVAGSSHPEHANPSSPYATTCDAVVVINEKTIAMQRRVAQVDFSANFLRSNRGLSPHSD